MSTSFNDLFETILNEGHVDVAVTGKDSENLRASLVRKFAQYKEKYDRLGFLSDEMKNLSMSAAPTTLQDGIVGTRYLLKVKAGRKLYTIIAASGNQESK